MEIKLSIIIPCYNLGSYLDNCLKSIENQNNDFVEYLFIDDGSTDSTSEKLKEFCDRSPQYQYFYQENQGVSVARNTALDYIQGDYVYLLDGDDELTTNATNKILEKISDHKADVILSPTKRKKNNFIEETRFNIPFGDFSTDEFFKIIKFFPPGPQLVYKTEIIKKFNLKFNQNLKVGEVFEFTLHFLNYCNTIRIIPNTLFYYVVRENSATNLFNYNKNLTILQTVEFYLQHGKKFERFNSYWVTLFKLINSFGYLKIIRDGLIDSHTREFVIQILNEPNVIYIINKVIYSSRSPLKDRLLAIYMKVFKSYGLKPLCFLLKYLKYIFVFL